MNAEVIKITPIIKTKQKNSSDNPTNILLNLKKAIAKNKKSNQLSKDEEAKIILDRLKKSIHIKSKKVSKKNIKKRIVPRKIKTPKKSHKKKTTSKKREVIKKRFVKKRAKVVTSKVKTLSSQSTKPIGFVKTLGVVGKSKVYEANDLTIDKREEITNDGVVDISTATTDELKHLPFVKPLEVIEVSQPFEASEAKKYQLDKR